MFSTIVLQVGPVATDGVNGDQIDDILRVVVDNLNVFMSGGPPYNTRETSLAIVHCEEALHWLAVRTADRVSRGVEDTETH